MKLTEQSAKAIILFVAGSFYNIIGVGWPAEMWGLKIYFLSIEYDLL